MTTETDLIMREQDRRERIRERSDLSSLDRLILSLVATVFIGCSVLTVLLITLN